MENHILKISELTTGFFKKHRNNIVLQKNINAEIKTGELIFMLGTNGSGKSTLLRTMLGLHKPLKGDVFYDDVPVNNITGKQLSAKVAVVFTGGINDSYLTAYEVVAMGRYRFAPLSGKLSENDVKVVNNAFEQVEMKGFESELFGNLSDGEKQKVLIARALVQETPFMFFDEPAAFIDAPGKISLMELLLNIVKTKNKGILLTTHDIDTALDYADTLWLLGKGKPFVTGVPEDLVLQGYIKHYFEHQGISFDKRKGKFEKDKNSTGKTDVFVSGGAINCIWLEKALVRKGFNVVKIKNLTNENGVVCKGGEFLIYKNGKCFHQTTSIETVLKVFSDGNAF